ncbi:MAG: Apocarotenoid-15,15'-oxygenase [Myxococcota bacterium]|nr:Apocarotenoid-15,15'-oxygenase [Myxococcota bacterium]
MEEMLLESDKSVVYADIDDIPGSPVRVVEGAIPENLNGVLLRNGPGKATAGGKPLHMFDRYGYVAALRLHNGQASFRGAHVRGGAYVAENGGQVWKQRRIFTNRDGWWSNFLHLDLANTVNHDVYYWGGYAVATADPGQFLLDAETLETKGPCPLNGLLKNRQSNLGPMPQADTAANRLVAYTVTPGGLGDDTLRFVEVDPEWRVKVSREFKLPGKAIFVHDLCFTPNWYLTTEFGRLNLGGALMGTQPLVESLQYSAQQPSRLFLASRTGPERLAVIPFPGEHQSFHFLNAFERADEVVVDMVVYENRVDFRAFYPDEIPHLPPGPLGGPWIERRVINPQTLSCQVTRFPEVAGELPEINPAKRGNSYRYAWINSRMKYPGFNDHCAFAWFNGASKLDWDTRQARRWQAPPRTFTSMPVFAPRGGGAEDDGWLLIWIIQAEQKKSGVVILDAAAPDKGPVARLELDVLLPAASHAHFAPLNG